jgi:peptide deformylase
MKEIVKEPNKVLREAARELDSKEIKTPKIQKLISEMKETLASTPDGVGLAAPQIGESLRIFIVSEEAEAIDRLKLAGKKKTAVVRKLGSITFL